MDKDCCRTDGLTHTPGALPCRPQLKGFALGPTMTLGATASPPRALPTWLPSTWTACPSATLISGPLSVKQATRPSKGQGQGKARARPGPGQASIRLTAAGGCRAETFKWSFVFHLRVDEKVKGSITDKVKGMEWWLPVEGAYWRKPFGPVSQHSTLWPCVPLGSLMRSRRLSQGSTIKGREKYPATQISWNDAVAYCRWKGCSQQPHACFVGGDAPSA